MKDIELFLAAVRERREDWWMRYIIKIYLSEEFGL